jgi:cysteine-rich repeat protein
LQGSTCVCATVGYYIASSPRTCDPCHYSCATCSDTTSTGCTSCNNSNQRTLIVASCPCYANYSDVGTALCQISSCSAGYQINITTNDCQDICGDGLLFTLQCDDGNTISGDGCSSTCQVESNYSCLFGSTTSASVCSYNQPIAIRILDIVKDPTKNSIDITSSISPALTSLALLNFSDVLKTNLTDVTTTISYVGNGTLLIHIDYTNTVQNNTVNLMFSPNVSSSQRFYATPNTSFDFVMTSTNNIAADYFGQAIYDSAHTISVMAIVIVALALIEFVVSLFTVKFVGVEMIGVVQVTYMGLVLIELMNPVLFQLTSLSFINGVNTAFTNQKIQLINNKLSAQY